MPQTKISRDTLQPAGPRLVFLLLALAAVISLAVPSAAGTGDGTRPKCETCRRFADSSPSRGEVLFTFGKRTVVKRFCSVFCYLELMEDYPDTEPDLVRIINYATLDTEMPLWIPLERAVFLLVNDGDPDKCRDPFAFAFQTRQQAEAAAGDREALILDSGELLELVKALTDEYEPDKPEYHHNSNRSRPRR